jgi:DinB superfamily
MNSVALLREALADAHGALERTVTGLDQDALEWVPPGTANPIGATLAHVVVSEDVMVNAILTTRGPLMASAYAERTGLSEPMPMPGPAWADYAAWARRLRVDQAALLDYGRAVWAASDAFLAGCDPDDLGRELDLSPLGRGHRTLGWAVVRLLCAHVDSITGEIACLKGLQGRGGYG